jgi:hypothetical protein
MDVLKRGNSLGVFSIIESRPQVFNFVAKTPVKIFHLTKKALTEHRKTFTDLDK